MSSSSKDKDKHHHHQQQPLIDAELLKGLSASQRDEALAAAAAAKRAEERAEQRAIEKALRRKEEERKRQREQEEEAALLQQNNNKSNTKQQSNSTSSSGGGGGGGVVFISKRKRAAAAAAAANNDKPTASTAEATTSNLKRSSGGYVPPSNSNTNARKGNNNNSNNNTNNNRGLSSSSSLTTTSTSWSEREVLEVKKSYLGKTAEEAEQERAEKRKKLKTSKKITFRFKWDEEDDTGRNDDPLYSSLHQQHQRHHGGGGGGYNKNYSNNGGRGGGGPARAFAHGIGIMGRRQQPRDALSRMSSTSVESVRYKPLGKMTTRDWRIFRENYEIVVKGGRAPPPMRSFHEMPTPQLKPLHPSILDAVTNVMKFRDPTPIQRQAIPIGLQRRDLIGIAETGSGKTIAFGIPICNYLLNLPSKVLNNVADEGPLALIMAPTRELALQINDELSKLLSRQRHIRNCVIIGGQQLQYQANELRKGQHILVGTPGRINECIEMSYLVLNQCACAVLDEGDRMIDMGFAPQIESVLDAMGAALKSENEQEAYQQEQSDLEAIGVPKFRMTALFSATMPLEVERMAKKYLRHPAVISIGDRDSGKNARIVQRIMFLSSPSQKERALRDLLARHSNNYRGPQDDNKTIVFVNEKKHADGVGRMVSRMGHAVVVLHGGKTQDEREENLGRFRKGGVVLVATDVAGRGIDIPNVTHVINYDLPARSIESYSHRIGRTGRAGKEGLATSFITDEDEAIMAPLKAYLESTGNPVPDRLAKHPAASSAQSNLIY